MNIWQKVAANTVFKLQKQNSISTKAFWEEKKSVTFNNELQGEMYEAELILLEKLFKIVFVVLQHFRKYATTKTSYVSQSLALYNVNGPLDFFKEVS